MSRRCINIGSGKQLKNSNENEEWFNIDKSDKVDADMILDLDTDKLPFQSESIDYVYMNQVVEHLSNPIFAFNEIWRVLKRGGKVEIWSPYQGSIGSWASLDHRREINEYTFRELCGYGYGSYEYGIECNFTQAYKIEDTLEDGKRIHIILIKEKK